MICMSQAEHEAFKSAVVERDRLLAIVNTPELIDFPKAVMLEAQHQEHRWGTDDRESKTPADWFRLVTHLSTRALAHHNEADRIAASIVACAESHASEMPMLREHMAHHREKAVHHTITTAAALAHWHASVVGKHTAMRPGIPAAESVPA